MSAYCFLLFYFVLYFCVSNDTLVVLFVMVKGNHKSRLRSISFACEEVIVHLPQEGGNDFNSAAFVEVLGLGKRSYMA